MILNKNVLKLAGAASTDQTRYTLNGVYVESDGSGVGCDGHIMLKVKPAMDCYEYARTDYPKIDGMDPAGVFDEKESEDENGKNKTEYIPQETLKPFILPISAIQQISKAIPKKSRVFPILEHPVIDVTATNLNGCAVIGTTDLENPQIFRPKKLDGQYPDYTKIMPDTARTVTVGFTVSVLEKLVKTLKSMDVQTFALGIDNAIGPMTIAAKTQDGDDITGAIMPCRLK